MKGMRKIFKEDLPDRRRNVYIQGFGDEKEHSFSGEYFLNQLY